MRYLVATVAVVAALAAAAAPASAALGWFPLVSGENGVACQVKKVTVLASDAKDCKAIGGKVVKPAQ